MPRNFPSLVLDEFVHATHEDAMDFYIQASLDNVPGVDVLVGTFSHDDIDTADGFIDSFGGSVIKQQFTPPTSNETLYISSTDAGDSQLIIVTYLDSDYEILTSTVPLDGQNFVLVANDFFRMRSFLSISGVATGNIYLSTTNVGSSGIPTDSTKIMEAMAAGFTSITSTLYTVPKDTSTMISTIQTSTTGGNNSDIITRTVVYSGAITTILQGNLFGPSTVSNETVLFQSPLPEGLTVVVRLSATQNNSRFSQRFFFVEFGSTFEDWRVLRRNGFVYNNEVLP